MLQAGWSTAVQAQVPALVSISPNSGPTAGGTTVTITGTNLTGATAVNFGSNNAASYVVNSASSITATSPTGSAGTVDITVTTPDGSSTTSAADQFTYVVAPNITRVSPTSGPASGGTTVIITGTNFSGATAVTFGGAAATGFTVNSATQITATAPAGSGTVDIRVTTTGGTSATSAADQYTYMPAPTISSVSPASGTTGGGTSVTITGSNFSGVTAVTFGSTAASFVAKNATEITATAPAGTGTVDIRVTTTGGTSAISAADLYTYVAPPVANAASATVAQGSSNNSITLNITGGPPTSVAVATPATHGTATANGTAITYTPTAGYAGTDTFTYTTTNGSGTSSPATVTITVSNPAMLYAPASPSAGAIGNSYSQLLAGASGGTAPYSYVLASGTLPAGMTLGSNGTLSGTPTQAGSFNFTITATDSSTGNGPFRSTSSTLTLEVKAPTISIGPVSLPVASVGATYSGTVTASGGTAPYSYTVTSGALPAGLSLASNGTLSGTPTAGGTFNFTITATDSLSSSGLYAYTVVVTRQTPVTGPVSASVAANSSANPITLSITGGAATSVAVGTQAAHGTATASGTAITYTPTAGYSGTDSFTYTATNAGGTSPAATVSITVSAPTLTITPATPSLPAATLNTAYTPVALSASGGTGPYSYTVTAGSLPAGLSLNLATGGISGTPTAIATYNFTITATDANNATGSRAYTLQVQATIPTAPAVAVSTAANQPVTINATANATGAPFTGVAVHTQPASGDVVVQGMNLVYTPAASTQGAINFAYTLTNAAGTSAPIAVTVQVAARTDPTANADVRGLSTAQQQATVRFAGAQLLNFTQRLEQLRNPNRQAFQNGLQLAMPRAGNNSIRNCQNVPSMLGQQDCIARQGMDSRASLAPSWSRATQQDALAATGGLTAEQAYASRLDSEAAEPGAATSLGSTQRSLAQRAVALGAGSPARTTRVNADEPLPAPGSPERPRLAYWTAGMLDWGFADASKGQDDGLRFTTSGVTMGFDYLVNAQWTVGMGMGLAYDRTAIGSEGSRNHSKGVSTALYGSWNPAPAYFVDGVLGYSRLRFDSRRWVADAGEFAEGERNGSQWFASVSAGYEWRTQQMMLSPYGRLQWARSNLDAYTETGAGWHALQFGEQRITSSSASLGLRGETSHDTRWGQLLPFGRLELQHDFDSQSDVRIAYADLSGGQGYAISSNPIGRNRVQIGFGSRLQSRMGTFAAELQFTRSNTSFQRGLRLSYTTRY